MMTLFLWILTAALAVCLQESIIISRGWIVHILTYMQFHLWHIIFLSYGIPVFLYYPTFILRHEMVASEHIVWFYIDFIQVRELSIIRACASLCAYRVVIMYFGVTVFFAYGARIMVVHLHIVYNLLYISHEMTLISIWLLIVWRMLIRTHKTVWVKHHHMTGIFSFW